jgi:hypothetical protein
VKFEVKDVSTDQVAVLELVHKYNSCSTPTIVVGNQIIIGFDPERLEQMLAE